MHEQHKWKINRLKHLWVTCVSNMWMSLSVWRWSHLIWSQAALGSIIWILFWSIYVITETSPKVDLWANKSSQGQRLVPLFASIFDSWMTNDCSTRATRPREQRPRWAALQPLIDLHVSHKHLMDPVNPFPRGRTQAHKKGCGVIKAGQQEGSRAGTRTRTRLGTKARTRAGARAGTRAPEHQS